MQLLGKGPMIFRQLAKITCTIRSSEYNPALASEKWGNFIASATPALPWTLWPCWLPKFVKFSLLPFTRHHSCIPTVTKEFSGPGKSHWGDLQASGKSYPKPVVAAEGREI